VTPRAPRNASDGSAQVAGVWSAHAWRRPPLPVRVHALVACAMFNTSLRGAQVQTQFYEGDAWRGARGHSEAPHGPNDDEETRDLVWRVLSLDRWYVLQQIEQLHPRDTQLYRFALAEMARRLEFFEIPVTSDFFHQ
jgi:hypothetical protein